MNNCARPAHRMVETLCRVWGEGAWIRDNPARVDGNNGGCGRLAEGVSVTLMSPSSVDCLEVWWRGRHATARSDYTRRQEISAPAPNASLTRRITCNYRST